MHSVLYARCRLMTTADESLYHSTQKIETTVDFSDNTLDNLDSEVFANFVKYFLKSTSVSVNEL